MFTTDRSSLSFPVDPYLVVYVKKEAGVPPVFSLVTLSEFLLATDFVLSATFAVFFFD